MVKEKSDNIIDRSISRAATIIKNGGTVAFPTETVFGLGANALNPDAVIKIFEAKERPFFDPLIVHIASYDQIHDLVKNIPEKAIKLAKEFCPGALTLVLPKKDIVPDIITSGLNSVAIRIPNHPTALKLLKEANCPIAAPSANKFGMISPTTAKHVYSQLRNDIDMILDSEISCDIGIESTIISFMNEQPELLRPGGIAVEEIEKCIGKILIPAKGETAKSVAPGMLEQHYSPRTEMILDKNYIPNKNLKIGKIYFEGNHKNADYAEIRILSESGSLAEAATNLYSTMRELDELDLDLIITELVPAESLGLGINDRLTRATAKKGV